MYRLNELPDLLTPLPIYLSLVLAVIAWRSGKLIWWLALAWAYLMSIPVLASLAGGMLEDQYRPIGDLERYRGYPVAMLCSGAGRLDSERGWVNRPANSGWERLLVATETARGVGGELLISGGAPHGSGEEPIALTMSKVIERMGIDLRKVTLETRSTNTYENLANLREQLGETPFILVTSATHLPRAMSVAEKLGLNAIPQPADYVSSAPVGLRSFLPSIRALQEWHIVLHELAGLLYYKLRGYR